MLEALIPLLAPSYARTGTVPPVLILATALLVLQVMSSAQTAGAKEHAGKDLC